MKLVKTGRLRPIKVDYDGEEVEVIIRELSQREVNKIYSQFTDKQDKLQDHMLQKSIVAWPFEEEGTEPPELWPVDEEHVAALPNALSLLIMEEINKLLLPPSFRDNSAD